MTNTIFFFTQTIFSVFTVTVSVKMKVLAKHDSAFERQVTEAVLIEVAEEGRLLNSKGGFNRCIIPRLQVAMGDRVAEHGDKNKKYAGFYSKE